MPGYIVYAYRCLRTHEQGAEIKIRGKVTESVNLSRGRCIES